MVQFRALQFIAINCKLELHVSSDLVAPLRVTRSGHVVRSKAAMRISFLIHWETLVAHDNPHVRAIAMGNLILALAVVRLAHIQRSQLVSVSPSALLFWCRQGKATIGGQRPPFYWTMPRYGVSGNDIGKCIGSLLKSLPACLEGSEFLLPSVAPAGATLLDAQSFVFKEMTYQRFTTLSREALTMAPLRLSSAESLKYSTYDARRPLPTAAGLLKFDVHERAALGNWRESIPGASSSGVAASMAVRYDHSKLAQSTQLKVEL
eukprot:9201893-Karenia_brevis.AAC.1